MGRPPADAGGARPLACEILRRVDAAGAYAGILLDERQPTLRDPREGALLRRIVMEVLRHRAALDHAIDASATRSTKDMDPAVRAALRVGAHGLLMLDAVPDFAAVDSAVRLVKREGHARAAGFVNAILRRIAAAGRAALPPVPERDDVAGLALHASHPEWWTRRVVDRLGWDAASALLAANNEPAATVLRPCVRRMPVEALRERLARDGVATVPGRFEPDALRVVSGALGGTRALAEGLALAQDEASQLVVRLFGERIGPRAADVCAAPGGKTLLIAERQPSDGRVVAADRHPGRLRRMARFVERVGGTGVLPVCADMAAAATPLGRTFDAVLVDAPCSGTGTLRRHPEIRWRLVPDDLLALAARQSTLLANAAALVAPGGRLVYSVCSLEPEEGEAVIDGFLASCPAFRIADPRPALVPAAAELVRGPGFLHTSPVDDGLDGFFAVALVREGTRS